MGAPVLFSSLLGSPGRHLGASGALQETSCAHLGAPRGLLVNLGVHFTSFWPLWGSFLVHFGLIFGAFVDVVVVLVFVVVLAVIVVFVVVVVFVVIFVVFVVFVLFVAF